MTISEAARQVGCSRSQLSRPRHHDQTFQDWIKASEEGIPSSDTGQMSSLLQRLHAAIDTEVQNGNVRVILWLADRMKLISLPEGTEQNAASTICCAA